MLETKENEEYYWKIDLGSSKYWLSILS